jgi:iron complex transport system substrate-binding protein
MMLSMASCTGGNNNENPSSTDRPSSTVSAFPMTVTDQAGRTVTIEKCPEKLVSGYYISTSMLIALGLEDKLVGIEAKANQRPIYKLSAPELINLPNVGTAKAFDLEGCLKLTPDLVILPLKLKSAAENLEKLGVDVLLVNPEDQELLMEMLELLSEATGTTTRAKSINDFIARQEKYLNDTLKGTTAPTVYLAGNSSLLSTAGDAMYQADMIRMAGGKNVAASLTDTYWSEISYEQLLTWNPEYIILASDATYSVDDVLNNKSLADCTAVKNKNVYQLPDKAEAWDSPVPGSILGALWLANILHEENVSDAECAARIDAYYEMFYDFTYSEN